MWETDFDAVDETIADGFEEYERLVILRVKNDLFNFALWIWSACCCYNERRCRKNSVLLQGCITWIALRSSILM